MSIKKTKVLVTGGSGYIGSCLASYLTANFSVFTLDKKDRSIFIQKNIKHFKININNKDKIIKVIKKIKPEFVIHLAAQSTIDMVDKKKNLYDKNNYQATKNLVEVIQNLRIPNLIFASTAAVYKEKKNKIKENSKIFSKNSYGKTKIKCENLIKKLNPNITKYCILRFFNVSSCYKNKKIGEFHNPETHLIPITIQAIFSQKKLHIYGDNYPTKDGTCNRDYIHVVDILRGIKKSIYYLSKKSNKSDIFNLGSGKFYSVLDVLKASFKETKNKTIILRKKKRKFDCSHLSCDINKAKKKLKWSPRFSNLKKIIRDEIWWLNYLNKKKLKRKIIY